MVQHANGPYCMVGPYLSRNIQAELEPLDDQQDVFGQAAAILRKRGYDVHYAEWLVTGKPRVVLLEARHRLMDWLDPYFDSVARKTLSGLGVEVRLNTPVETASAEGVFAGEDWLKAGTRVWTAGVEASPLVRRLPGEHDGAGRSHVGEHLTLPDHPEVYVIGDAGVYTDPRIGPLPPTASVAVQQGPWVARDLKRRLRGAESKRGRPPFRFFDRGYVVSLGPESAVADAVGLRLRGPAAQALYRSVLLYYMKSRRDRILTGADWAMERTLGRVGFGTQSPERAD